MGFWVEFSDDEIRCIATLHLGAAKLKRRPQECSRALGQAMYEETKALMGVLERHGYDFKT